MWCVAEYEDSNPCHTLSSFCHPFSLTVMLGPNSTLLFRGLLVQGRNLLGNPVGTFGNFDTLTEASACTPNTVRFAVQHCAQITMYLLLYIIICSGSGIMKVQCCQSVGFYPNSTYVEGPILCLFYAYSVFSRSFSVWYNAVSPRLSNLCHGCPHNNNYTAVAFHFQTIHVYLQYTDSCT